jgi:tRNA(Arg) A34 adenosine deaminase TadA
MMSDSPSAHSAFMRTAIERAVDNVHDGGGPFAALVVRDGAIIAQGTNRVTASNDPTAHAEMMAIRAACTALGRFHLDGCMLYTTCEPCPMCLGAIYWARLDGVFYAGTREDAAAAGFDDAHIYEEVNRPPEERSIRMRPCLSEAGRQPFDAWSQNDARVGY